MLEVSIVNAVSNFISGSLLKVNYKQNISANYQEPTDNQQVLYFIRQFCIHRRFIYSPSNSLDFSDTFESEAEY